MKTALYYVSAALCGMVLMFLIDIYLGPPVEKLPADYGMDNPPVMICLDKEDQVIPCE